MATLYITEQGAIVRRVDERIIVEHEKEVLADIPIIKVDQVVLFGRVGLTTPVIETLLEQGIELCFLNQWGRFLGRLQTAQGKNCLVRADQFRAAFDAEQATYLARQFVIGKLKNMLNLLMRARREGVSLPEEPFLEINHAVKALPRAENVDGVCGLEGAGSAAYFRVFGNLLKREFQFHGRVRRPPADPVNSLLSFAYTLLAKDIASAVNTVGLDPYTGFLHRDRYGRVSLALDLAEEFRPIVADAVVLSVINRGTVMKDDFEQELGGAVKLKDDARKRFLAAYEQKKQSEIRHPYFKYRATYRRCMELQARLLVKYLQGEVDKYLPLVTK